MSAIKVLTQAELIEALSKFNPKSGDWIELRGSGLFEVRGSSQVRAYGSSQVTAYDSSQVRAYDSSQVTAYGFSQVTAYGFSQVTAYGFSQVTACDSSQVTAYDSSQVRACDSSQVRACGSSQVTAYGFSQVTAYGFSQVTACDSSQVTAYDSSQVRACDSSQVTAYDSSQVTACDSSQVRAYDSSQVTAAKQVAVTIHGVGPKVRGGVRINYKYPSDVDEWLASYCLKKKRGIVILYKGVGDDYKSPLGTSYAPGTKPEAADWDDGKAECGYGLHFCAHPALTVEFNRDAKRFIACPVKVSEIVVHKNPRYPTKVKALRVYGECFEVDINGNPVAKK